MATVSLKGLHKAFGAQPILRGLDLEIAEGEFVVLVGPSGCGKSTLLRTLAGLEEPEQGSVHIDGIDVTHAAPRDRKLGMVFQSYALYPHLSVRGNIGFGLKLRGEPASEIARHVDRAATMLGLTPLLDRLPKQLSGGQRQRVAMARALAREPGLLLFDEPLSNLDAALRAQVRVEIKKLHAELGSTMVYVTHDQVEAMTLADRLVVLNAGRVEQQGPPLSVYQHPGSRFVAGFLGSPAMNFLELTRTGNSLGAEGLTLTLPRAPDASRAVLGLRPHDLHPPTEQHAATVRFVVEVVEAMGFESYAYGTVAGSSFVARVDAREAPLPRRGDTLTLGVAADDVHLFDAETGASLRGAAA